MHDHALLFLRMLADFIVSNIIAEDSLSSIFLVRVLIPQGHMQVISFVSIPALQIMSFVLLKTLLDLAEAATFRSP